MRILVVIYVYLVGSGLGSFIYKARNLMRRDDDSNEGSMEKAEM